MGQVNVVRQAGFHFGVETHPMADVGQVCPFRTDAFYKFQGLFQVEMRMVRFDTQGVDGQDAQTL